LLSPRSPCSYQEADGNMGKRIRLLPKVWNYREATWRQWIVQILQQQKISSIEER